MTLGVGPPPAALQRAFDRFLSNYSGVTSVDIETRDEHLKALRRALAPVALDGDVPFVMVRSRFRFSYLHKRPEGTLIVDDKLRRDTFSSLESYVFMRDRPLTAWVYFALVFAELASVRGFRNAVPVARSLVPLVEETLSRQLDPRGFVPRPQLQIKSFRLLHEGEDQSERLRVQASHIFPSLHEVGHWVCQEDSTLAQTAANIIRDGIEADARDATIGDMGSTYWISPEQADPRYGPARLTEPGSADALRASLRAEVVEEVFCDWFGLTLLLADESFAELSAATLLEVVQRHLAWNQLLLDAERELRSIAETRKRWRPLVYDAAALRQQVLAELLGNPELTRLILGKRGANRVLARLDGFDREAFQARLRPSLVRRHYLRFLGLDYPLGEDLLVKDVAAVAAWFRGPKIPADVAAHGKPVWHQPAEWGSGDPKRLETEASALILRGRLDRLDLAEADDIEWLGPYLQEGYGLLSNLRRRYWSHEYSRTHQPSEDPEWSHVPIAAVIDRLGGLSRLSRLSHTQWIEEQGKNDPSLIPDLMGEFFRGYLSEAAARRGRSAHLDDPIIHQQWDARASVPSSEFVASASGRRFHLPSCPTVSQGRFTKRWTSRDQAAAELKPCRVCKP